MKVDKKNEFKRRIFRLSTATYERLNQARDKANPTASHVLRTIVANHFGDPSLGEHPVNGRPKSTDSE